MSTRSPDSRGYRFPPEIISYAVWLYHRFCLSFRDVEELLADRGVIVSYEAGRQWCLKFGSSFAKKLRYRQDDAATQGISTKFLSRFKGSVINYGRRWTKTGTYSIFSFSRTGINMPLNASFASC